MNSSPKLPNARDLAYAFASELLAEIGADNVAEVIDRNATEPNPSVCHSHDFCDANMAMAAAWQRLAGYEVVPSDDRMAAVWNEAWRIARADEFATDCVIDDERSNGTGRAG